MESTNILRSGGLSGGPTTEMASIGGGSSEAVSRSGASSAFDLNVGIDLGNEGGVHGSDVSKGAKRKLIDLNEDAVDEDVESLKKGKGFDLNVELKEVEEVATAETETNVSVVQPPPAKVKLPPSSAILDLHGASFSEFISVYAFFRCFSTVLFLSPFEVADEFAASVVCNEPTPLFDAIHLSLMRAVRRYTSAFDSLRSLNWDVLDSITWPVFLVEYLSLRQPKHIPGLDLSESSPLRTDYYSIPTSVKVAVLQHLCDDLVETEVYKSELSKRVTMEESGDWKMKHFSSKGKKKVGKRSASSSGMKEKGDAGCFLCKMDGNTLIFCDSCPAAMHTRCVGVVTSKLPKGDWHCPECRLGQGNYYNLANSTREAQLLGTDHHGRLYYQVCHYLLVVEQNLGAADECSLRVYKRDDLAAVVAALDESSCVLHERISRAISEHWNISSHEVQRMTTTSTLRARSTQGCRASSSTKASYKKNLYEFAGMASVISEEMTSVATASRSSERIIAQQLKIIQGGKPDLFSWANAYHLNVYLNNKKEKCGWCFACNNDRDCLFVTSDLIQSSDVLGVRSTKGQTTDRDDDMDSMRSIESRLQAFLQDTRSDPTCPENMAALNKLLVEVPITIEFVVLLRLCLCIHSTNAGINWLFSEIKSKKEAPARSKMAEEVCNFITFAGGG